MTYWLGAGLQPQMDDQSSKRVRFPSSAPKKGKVVAKKLYHIGFETIVLFIAKHNTTLRKLSNDTQTQELAKTFGRAHYQLSIEKFINKYKLDKSFSLQTLTLFNSLNFIEELSKHLQLERFEGVKDIKIIFYIFVYFLHHNPNREKEKIIKKLFEHYFLHTLSIYNTKTQTNINYKDMTLSYIKSKPIELKESYTETQEGVFFTIFINKEEKVTLKGKSIKTLRKKAYKQIFFFLLDNADTFTPKQNKQLSIKEVFDEI